MGLLAFVVAAGIALGYDHWQDGISDATAQSLVTASTDTSTWQPGEPAPAAGRTSAGGRTGGQPAVPTFEPLRAPQDGGRPVVLLVGDGYAEGQGASSHARSRCR